MIPVEQREPTGCLRACVASILELDYDAVPPEIAAEATQMTSFLVFMASRGFSIGDYSLCGGPGLPDEPQQRCRRYWPTLWIASVLSPRISDPCEPCDGSGLVVGTTRCRHCKGAGSVPGWHTVVMKNSTLVWDPHPGRDQGHLGFVHAHVPYVIDPARVIVKVVP